MADFKWQILSISPHEPIAGPMVDRFIPSVLFFLSWEYLFFFFFFFFFFCFSGF